MRITPVLAVATALGLLIACDHGQPPQYSSLSPTGPSSGSSTRPAIEGTVQVAGGGLLADATVTLLDRNFHLLRSAQTDPAGRFQIASSTVGCEGTSTLRVQKTGYHTRDVVSPACVQASGPEPVAVTIKVIEDLQASEQIPVRTTLSNDDLDWDRVCGPCKFVSLPEPGAVALDVTIEWSSSDRFSFWLTASDRNYDGATLGTWQAELGARTQTITIEPSHGDYFYYMVVIGLPAGSRATGGLTGVTDLKVSVKPR